MALDVPLWYILHMLALISAMELDCLISHFDNEYGNNDDEISANLLLSKGVLVGKHSGCWEDSLLLNVCCY